MVWVGSLVSIKVKGGGVQVEAEQSPRERDRWKSDAPSNLSSGQFCLGGEAVASTIERGSPDQRGILTPLCHYFWLEIPRV